MPRELKFDDAKIHGETTEPKKIPNAGDVKKFIERGLKLEEDKDMAVADIKSMYADAKEQGIDPKALKIVITHKKRPMSTERRQEVNEIMEKSGDQPYFAFV